MPKIEVALDLKRKMCNKCFKNVCFNANESQTIDFSAEFGLKPRGTPCLHYIEGTLKLSIEHLQLTTTTLTHT